MGRDMYIREDQMEVEKKQIIIIPYQQFVLPKIQPQFSLQFKFLKQKRSRSITENFKIHNPIQTLS